MSLRTNRTYFTKYLELSRNALKPLMFSFNPNNDDERAAILYTGADVQNYNILNHTKNM